MRRWRTGQAVILLLLALGIFLLGALGLAVESSLYYTHRQMAQAAADAAAQAAITSIYSRTNTGANAMDGTSFTCTNGSDLRTPCHFARQHGFGTAGSADIIAVDFPSSVPGVGDLSSETPAIVGVTISRPFTSSLTSLVGGLGATVSARGVAAILIEISPVPILIMHPDEPGSFDIDGGPQITICGGPPRSINVNSESPSSFTVSGGGSGSNLIDLSRAGPPNGGGGTPPCDGGGGEFGNHGGPVDMSLSSNGYPGGSILPTDGYIRALAIDDPLAPMVEPSNIGLVVRPGPIGTRIGGGVGAANGCQRPSNRTCSVYAPGIYEDGIDIQGDMALFQPGLYYITDRGFQIRSDGVVHMDPLSGCDPAALPFGCGMLIYNSPNSAGDTLSIASNAGQIQGVTYGQTIYAFDGTPISCTGNCLQGTLENGAYLGALFMNDRRTTFAQTHSFQGGGGLTLAGTLYFTNDASPYKENLWSNLNYQRVELRGNPGSTTRVVGQILVDGLTLGGNASILMTLNPNSVHPIRKLALIR